MEVERYQIIRLESFFENMKTEKDPVYEKFLKDLRENNYGGKAMNGEYQESLLSVLLQCHDATMKLYEKRDQLREQLGNREAADILLFADELDRHSTPLRLNLERKSNQEVICRCTSHHHQQKICSTCEKTFGDFSFTASTNCPIHKDEMDEK